MRCFLNWTKQALDDRNLDYIAAPQAMQSDLRKARQQIDRPPDWHQHLPNCHHGLALGTYWHPVLKHLEEADRTWSEARRNGWETDRGRAKGPCWDDDEPGRPEGYWCEESDDECARLLDLWVEDPDLMRRDWWEDDYRGSNWCNNHGGSWWNNRGGRGTWWQRGGGNGWWQY